MCAKAEGDTVKLLIFSDSHGNTANMADMVRLEQPDQVLHLGDLVGDAQKLAEQFPKLSVAYVPGNCDGRRPDLPEERCFTLEGCKIFMTHGHTYHVKLGMGAAVNAARAAGANLLCFGHTHESYCHYERGLWIVNPGTIGSITDPSYAVAVLEGDGAVCYISRV